MHAYLVTGQNRSERVKELLLKHGVVSSRALTFTSPRSSIGIEQVREITHISYLTASRLPQSILIEDAHKMTLVAQNAFLKILEEPPVNTIIILSALSEDSLLPTVRSRCIARTIPFSLTSLTPEFFKEQEELFKKLSESGIGEKIAFAEETGKVREEAIEFVEGQLLFLHSRLQDTSGVGFDSPEVEKIGKTLLQTLLDLRANINPKMTLFELLKSY